MTTWSALIREIATYIPACPDPVAEQALARAAEEFCRRTQVWVEWLEPIAIVAGVREYDIEPPAGAQVLRMLQATVDATPMDIRSWRLAPRNPATGTVERSGVSSADLLTLWLSRELPAGSRLELQVQLAPTRTATSLPDWIAARHFDVLAAGALARLFDMRGSWTDPRAARRETEKFERLTATACAHAWQGNAPTVPRASPKWC